MANKERNQPLAEKFHPRIGINLAPTEKWENVENLENTDKVGPGCGANCCYCNQSSEMLNGNYKELIPYISLRVDAGLSINSRLMCGDKIIKRIPIDVLIEEISNYPAYDSDCSLMLENFNDPGVNWNQTIELISKLRSELGHTGPIVFLTKHGITEGYVAQLARLQREGARIIAGVTYANLPKAIEPIGNSGRLTGLKKLNEAGIPTIVSMRPIIHGINDSKEIIKQTLRNAGPHATLITCGGLFVYDFTHEAFQKAGYPLDEDIYPKTAYSSAKILKSGFKEQVRQQATEIGIQAPVMDHFSCCVATIMTCFYEDPRSDKMARWTNPWGEIQKGCANCPSTQQQICKKKSEENVNEIITLAQEKAVKIGLTSLFISPSIKIPGLLVVENQLLTMEQLFTIESYCGWDVNNLPTQEQLVKESGTILDQTMNLNWEEIYLNSYCQDQDWHILVHGISENEKMLAEKYLRGQIRARINLVLDES